MTRWRIACDACDVAAWIGPAPDGDAVDAWCEGCQRATAGATTGARCTRCGQPLTLGAPRFEELYGRLQELVAVLAAWAGDLAPLARLLPERPRFLTDLTPPEAATDDPPALRDALRAVLAGHYAIARAALEPLAAGPAAHEPRVWRALAIAADRLGDPAGAEAAWTRVLALVSDDEGARLGRGAARARRGAFADAAEDFARAGDRHEAKWDRAACRVLAALAANAGMPAPDTLAAARAEAPPASDYWIDPTVGRLLFAALTEQLVAAHPGTPLSAAEAQALRAAAGELEFDTYWDRALLVHGFARAELASDAAAVAASLTAREGDTLAAEPAIAGPAGGRFRAAVLHARAAIVAGDPATARAALEPLLARDQPLAHYRVPCVTCGRGTIGVEALDEEDAPTGPEA